jgi:hypothetical protein
MIISTMVVMVIVIDVVVDDDGASIIAIASHGPRAPPRGAEPAGLAGGGAEGVDGDEGLDFSTARGDDDP